jgi:ABC-type transporter Mla maintaining outer membrane lipid asymmetry ATPase subunit MlaF
MLACAKRDTIEAASKGDYLMITSFEITNFRCFQHVKQGGLKRFNFIVGGSGSGKTALLEALFLTGGSNPEIYFRTRRWRGFSEGISIPGTRESYESLFRDLFYNFDQESGARIRFLDTNLGNRTLDIFYEGDEVLDLPLKASSAGSQDIFSVIPIVFKWEGPKRVTRSQVEIAENGQLRMKGSRDVYQMTFVSSHTMDARQNALKYSELSKVGKAGPILGAMKELYPEIVDLTIEFVAGEPMLHASIEGMAKKVAIANLSGGMNKYLSVILAIASMPFGAVAIDEIENGFYYDHLERIVRGIMTLSTVMETQVFATTHSYELLQAVSKAIEDEQLEKDTTLIRLEKPIASDPPTLHLVLGKNYRAALESSFEVR